MIINLLRWNKMVGFLLFISILLSEPLLAQEKTRRRPNVLWITIEDTSPQFIGAYGNKFAKTPTIDSLAKAGIRFTNAFSTGTVCSPSRSTIITGVKTYQLGTGHHRSTISIPDNIKGFPYFLKKQGYYVTNNKKTDYNIANGKQFVQEAWNESSGEAGWWNRMPGQPFFAVVNFMESHQSRTMTWSYEQYKREIFERLPLDQRIADDDFPLPPIYHNSPEMRREFARVYNSLRFTDLEIDSLLKRLKRDQLLDSTIIFFYADHGEGMPRGKTNGIDYGYRVPLVVCFPPMYHDLCPWGPPGSVSNELISFEDLAPTMLSLAGAEIPAYLQGRVLIGEDRSPEANQIFLSNDRSDNGPDLVRSVTDGRYFYSRNFMAFEPELRYIRYIEIGAIKQQMRADYRDGKLDSFQQSLFMPRAPEVFYDTQEDPWQLKNLAASPAYREFLLKFRLLQDSHIVRERDILFLPEYETNLLQKNTTLYEHRRREADYPLNKIYEAARLSGFRTSATTEKQATYLQDSNKVVRYWAIMGLRSQPAALLKKYREKILAAVKDPYPPVAVTAAAIAYDNFPTEEATSRLLLGLQSKNMDEALLAINFLLYSNDPSPFADSLLKMSNQKGLSYNVKAACNDVLGRLHLISNDAEHEAD